ncbi:DNA glycosylase AlkZ-like family protein [Egicoccus halophilus]|uniref:Winged helix DNA-binding domain-containing protein n=1 Tax=Egicoccus halophilus TaxID=1670830 RepID=A0A8J3AG97_9ACTN|nr:crosslink repair DNA glycosylase YcaQ family protein [Egicoccus halophilus]GGI08154.1 hypothetical protein GCM10011354_27670 [Egicoccus halophilus]
MDVSRARVLRFRATQQGLAGDGAGVGSEPGDHAGADAAVLDLGVQDTGGPGAARWALSLRGSAVDDDALVLAWTLRGAPHAYRRGEVATVAAATAPYDEADARKRIFDAARPLRQAGIPVLDALRTVAGHLRDIVDEPRAKGEVSAELTRRLPAPYLRTCRPCQAVHIHEQPFRLAALPAGLELEPGTSPPVLRRLEGWEGPASEVPGRLDPIRAAVHLLGPTTAQLVASYLDAPVRTVKAHWPPDTLPVTVDGERREILEADRNLLADPPGDDTVRLLGAFDPWLQARDRELLVPDAAARRDLWRVLGRPGALLIGAEAVGSWRPRSSGATLRLQVVRWDGGGRPVGLDAAAEALAAHRGQRFGGYVET